MIARIAVKLVLAALGITMLCPCAMAQCLERGNFTYCPNTDTMYAVTETSLVAIQVGKREIKWKVRLEDGAYVKPVFAAGIVALIDGAPATLRGYDATTGKPAWSIESRTGDLTAMGPYFFGDIDKPEGLIEIEARTGKIIWTRSMGKGNFVHFLASVGPLLLTNVFAFEGHSNRLLKNWPVNWMISVAAISGDLRIIGTESAWPHHETLAVYSGADYKLLWTRRDASEPIVAGIAAEGDKMLVATYNTEEMFHSGTAKLEMLAARTGKPIWTKEITADYMLLNTPVTLVDGTAIFFMDDTADSSVVQAFDADTGAQKWMVHADRRLVDGVICSGGRCFIGSVGDDIAEIDARTGAVSWLAVQ